MSNSLPGRVARTAAVFIAGLFAASALTASVAAAPATVSSTLTRVTSCAGMNFHPIDSRTDYRWDDRTLWRRTDAGDGWYFCDPGLPNKAIVTSVGFTVDDQLDKVDVRFCALVRISLAAGGSATPVAMAVLASTGMAAKPGVVRQTLGSVSHATIDESRYAYWLQCQIYFDPSLSGMAAEFAGIIGATVTYRISSTNG